jgi:NitT/TauT family transport system substrate-binding protein
MKRTSLMKKWAMISCTAVLLLTGCGSSAPASEPASTPAPAAPATPTAEPAKAAEPVTVRFSEVIRSIFYAPQYVAMEKGFFEEEGLIVDMVTSQGSDKGAAALIAGSADIALGGPETAIYIHNEEGDTKLKIFYQLTATDGSFLLARTKKDSFDWATDLNGQTIVGWRPGSAPMMVMSSLLDKHQTKDTEVITNIAAPAMVGAFESGEQEYIQLYEPVASMLEEQGKAYVVASVGEAFGTFPQTSYAVTEEYLAENPEVLEKWTAALSKATKWMQEQPIEEVASALEPYFTGTSLDLIQKSVVRYQDLNAWAVPPVMTEEQFNVLQETLVKNGVLKEEEKVTYTDIVDPSFAEKVTN